MLDFGGIHLSVLVNTILRSLVIYVAVLAALRLAGKRHVGQLSIVDFVLVLLVSNSVQNAMVGSDTSLAGGLVAALTLVAANLVLTGLVFVRTGSDRCSRGSRRCSFGMARSSTATSRTKGYGRRSSRPRSASTGSTTSASAGA